MARACVPTGFPVAPPQTEKARDQEERLRTGSMLGLGRYRQRASCVDLVFYHKNLMMMMIIIIIILVL